MKGCNTNKNKQSRCKLLKFSETFSSQKCVSQKKKSLVAELEIAIAFDLFNPTKQTDQACEFSLDQRCRKEIFIQSIFSLVFPSRSVYTGHNNVSDLKKTQSAEVNEVELL